MDTPPTGPTDRPFATSLCHLCAHHAVVRGAHSSFLKCDHPGLPRYRDQPVRWCEGFTPNPSPAAA